MSSNSTAAFRRYRLVLRTYQFYIDRENLNTHLNKEDFDFLPDLVSLIPSLMKRKKVLKDFFEKKPINPTSIDKYEKVFNIIKHWTHQSQKQ